jgi:hypothetical protein
MWELTAKEKFHQFLKTAGEVNTEQLQRLRNQLRPGDIVNFETRFGDVAKEHGVRTALKDMLISKPIAAVTGSPQTHTAMLTGINPDGTLQLVHNYEQGNMAKVHQVSPEQFEDFAKTRNLSFYRPAGATPQQGATAAARATRSAAGNAANYSYSDLGLSLARQTAEKAKEVSPMAGAGVKAVDAVSEIKRTAKGCDPASGFCSHLATDAWSEPLGGAHNAQKLMGTNPTNPKSSLAVTPGSIHKASMEGKLTQVGSYAPKNPTKNFAQGAIERIQTKIKSPSGVLGAAKRLAGGIIGAKLP